MALLLDVFLLVLVEELLPHVLQWKDRRNKLLQVIFLNKGNPEWDSTYLTLFKIMDSFNKSKQEVYSSESNNDTKSKRRCMANIKKFVDKGELICHPEEKDGGKKIHVLEITLSEEEIIQRINNMSEQEKQIIRHTVIEEENNKRKGTKRNSPEHSPSTSSRKRFKSNTSIEDLPCTSAEVPPHQVSSSSLEHNQRSAVINCFITYNVTIPVEETQNPLVNQLLNQILNNQVSPPHPIKTHGPPVVRTWNSSNPYLDDVCPITSYTNEESFYPQPEENNELCVNNNYPVVRVPEEKSEINPRLELQDLLNEIAANEEDGSFGRSTEVPMYQGVEERPPENLDRGVINNGRSTEVDLYQVVEEGPPENLEPSVFINRSTEVSMYQQVEERPSENPERGVINEHHFSFPDLTSHEMVQGILGETEPSLGHDDLNEFNLNCGSI